MFKWLRSASRLNDLENRLTRLEDQRKTIGLEWDAMYEKFRLLYVRLSKRVERLNQAPSQEDTQPGESDAESGAGTASLSPRQLEVMRAINARRRKVVQ